MHVAAGRGSGLPPGHWDSEQDAFWGIWVRDFTADGGDGPAERPGGGNGRFPRPWAVEVQGQIRARWALGGKRTVRDGFTTD